MDEPRIFHLRYGMIVMYNKHCRVVIARVDGHRVICNWISEWEFEERKNK